MGTVLATFDWLYCRGDGNLADRACFQDIYIRNESEEPNTNYVNNNLWTVNYDQSLKQERLQAVHNTKTSVQGYFGDSLGHSSAGNTVNRMNQLQNEVQQWAQPIGYDGSIVIARFMTDHAVKPRTPNFWRSGIRSSN